MGDVEGGWHIPGGRNHKGVETSICQGQEIGSRSIWLESSKETQNGDVGPFPEMPHI